MGSWITIQVEVTASDRRAADTQFIYVEEAINRLPFVENCWPHWTDVDIEEDRDREPA